MADNIELELETQLASQHEALEGINEAINLGGDNPAEGHAELLQMRDELRAAVSEMESALLEIKRARILQQLAVHATARTNATSGTKLQWPLPPPQTTQAVATATASPSTLSGGSVQPGSMCHFRYMDSRWYAGYVLGPGRQAGILSVAFQVPTRPFMLDPVDVMEALVRPCADVPALATRTSTTTVVAADQLPQAGYGGANSSYRPVQIPVPPQRPQQLPLNSGGVSAVHGGVVVGRRALALLPKSRLYVPVEVVSLDMRRGTATVMPLQAPHWQGRGLGGDGGDGGGGSGEEVVVPLQLVTRQAHVAPPPPPAALEGGSGCRVDRSDSEGGSGSSISSPSNQLRPRIRTDDDMSGDEGGDVYGNDDDEVGEEEESDDGDVNSDSNGGAGGDVMDLYNSDSDGERGRKRRRGGSTTAREARGGDLEDAVDDDTGGGGDDDDDIGLDVLGHAKLAVAAGTVNDAMLLAEWEAHGRGVASRLLVRMGYMRGKGLGNQGQGTMCVPEVLLLPERKGLGAVDRDRVRRVGGGGGSGKLQGGVEKRRSKRGGAKQKRKRAIIASREARREVREAEEGSGPGGGGLFDFINSSLGDSSAAARIRKAQVSLLPGGAKGSAAQTAGAAAIAGALAASAGGSGSVSRRPLDRQGLMTHHDAVASIQTKLARLHEMLGRHKDNRGLRAQIEAQIRTLQAELTAAQAAAARASKAIHDKDAQKKWLKF